MAYHDRTPNINEGHPTAHKPQKIHENKFDEEGTHSKKKKERKVADLHGLNETRRGWRRRDEVDRDETRLA